MRRRVVAAALLVVAIAAGVGVHYAAPGDAISDVSGDALYAVAAYLAVVIVAPGLPVLATGAIALVWCAGVELFQLTGVPLRLGEVFPPAMLVLGTVFDARDLVVYAITVVVAVAADLAVRAATAGVRRDRTDHR